MRMVCHGAPDWAARALVMGADVAVDDAGALGPHLDRARLALPGLTDWFTADEGRLVDAVAAPDLVIGPGGVVPGETLIGHDPAWLVPEAVVRGDAAAMAALRRLGVAAVDRLTDLPRGDDAALVGVLRALKQERHGPGATLADDEARWAVPVKNWSAPVVTGCRAIPLDWLDYNGHMTEARYLHAFGNATDRFMAVLGCDPDYIAAGQSYFTAETHIRHLGEAHAGERIRITTQALHVDGPKLHFFHRMERDGDLIATGEHFLLHVSLRTRRPAPPLPPLDAGLARLAAGHRDLDRPDGAGRFVGQRR